MTNSALSDSVFFKYKQKNNNKRASFYKLVTSFNNDYKTEVFK